MRLSAPFSQAPFSQYERMIAWRYIRAGKSNGGVSTMTWISLIGIILAVAAMVVTLAVRSGFRTEFVDTILGANAHVTVYSTGTLTPEGAFERTLRDYEELARRLATVEGVVRAAPLVRFEVMASAEDRTTGVSAYGIMADDLRSIPRIANPETSVGQIGDFDAGVAIGSGVARRLDVGLGDQVTLISPNGVRTAFGTSPRISSYPVVYIFTAGRWDIDRTRLYMPLAEAQKFYNRDGQADEIEVTVQNPQEIEAYLPAISQSAGDTSFLFTWKQSSGNFLRALEIEDNAMFIILSVLVMLSSMNISSGLIMLVKNKGQDIGILRTVGVTQASILRIFLLCGVGLGAVGTLVGVGIGALIAYYLEPIFGFVTAFTGGQIWDPSVRGIYSLPSELRLEDVLKAVALSMGLSCLVTYFPARKAARLDPVKALRNE